MVKYFNITQLSIRRKLTIIIVAVSSAVLILSGILFYAYDRSRYRDQMVAEVETVARIISDNVTAAIVFDDPSTAKEIMNALSADTRIVFAALHKDDGSRFATYYVADMSASFSTEMNNDLPLFHDGFMHLNHPVILDGDQIGVLYLKASLAGLSAMQRQLAVIYSIIIIVFAGVAYGLAYRFQRVISSPIISLTEASQKLSKEKDYNIRVENGREDELGQLTQSFNTMLDQIQKEITERIAAEKTVKKSNVDLEKAQESSLVIMEDLENTLANLNAEISERKEAEDALKESEERFSNVFYQSNDGIILHSKEGAILDVNSKALELFQYSYEEIKKLKIANLHPPSAMAASKQAFDRIMRDGLVNFDIEFLRKDGSIFQAEVSSNIMEINEEIIIQGMIRDITEKKAVERSLKESEEKYREIFESFTDIYFRTDEKMNITVVSPSVYQITGYQPEEIINKKGYDFYYYLRSKRNQLMKALEKSNAVKGHELIGRHKDGHMVIVSADVRKRVDEKGNFIGLEGTLSDITQRKNAEDQLRKAHDELELRVEKRTSELQDLHAEKNRFISHASHDLRTPIAAILGFSKLLPEGKWGELNEKQKECVEKIETHAVRLSKIVGDLLSISRIEAGVIGVAKDQIRISKEIALVKLEMRELLKNKNQKLTIENDDESLMVIGDKGSIHQILTNLVDNASKYSEENKVISIDVTQLNGTCCVDVKDEGMGLSAEDQHHIYEEFYRAKNSGALQAQGTGLGLAIVKKLVEQMGGRVAVKSDGPGTGSTFSFSLPIAHQD